MGRLFRVFFDAVGDVAQVVSLIHFEEVWGILKGQHLIEFLGGFLDAVIGITDVERDGFHAAQSLCIDRFGRAGRWRSTLLKIRL